MEFITQPWPWYVGGPLIALTLFLMFYFGKAFGVSTTLETFCSVAGAGKLSEYFKVDIQQNSWRFVFVLGILLGGLISSAFLMSSQGIDLHPDTVKELADLGFANAGGSYLPEEIFSMENLFSLKGFLILIGAGILIGFGSRYAGGCTSGHAISGLSNLQLPSLVAVIGFFIGGLVMIWFLFPFIFLSTK